MLKRSISGILAAVMCLALLCGCAKKDEVPDGMFSVTLDGEPFILYVPEGWTDNRGSGISSAYYLSSSMVISARYHALGEETLDGYIDRCIEGYKDTELIGRSSDVKLGGKSATRLELSFDYNDEKMKHVQYFVEHNKNAVMLNIYCPEAKYGDSKEIFDLVVEEFVLTEAKSADEVITDKKTPEGMKIASPDNVEYKFYVPATWKCTPSQGIADAYYDESGRPNVSVISHAPDGEITAKGYFEQSEAEFKEELEGYEFISQSERKVSDIDAISFTYKLTYGSAEYKIMQTVFVYEALGLVYSITYTALAESFDAHLDDVTKMLDAFTIR